MWHRPEKVLELPVSFSKLVNKRTGILAITFAFIKCRIELRVKLADGQCREGKRNWNVGWVLGMFIPGD
jgi:hypothetical protein